MTKQLSGREISHWNSLATDINDQDNVALIITDRSNRHNRAIWGEYYTLVKALKF